jgi:hypothetical protein
MASAPFRHTVEAILGHGFKVTGCGRACLVGGYAVARVTRRHGAVAVGPGLGERGRDLAAASLEQVLAGADQRALLARLFGSGGVPMLTMMGGRPDVHERARPPQGGEDWCVDLRVVGR